MPTKAELEAALANQVEANEKMRDDLRKILLISTITGVMYTTDYFTERLHKVKKIAAQYGGES